MSKWIKCENCGQEKEIPAYEGDGVYSTHICSDELTNEPLPEDMQKLLEADECQ